MSSSEIGDFVSAHGTYQALPDPLVDRVFSVTMALAAELWTVRDRLRLVEAALAAQGLSVDGFIDTHLATPDQIARMTEDRDQFIARVFGPLTARFPAGPK